MDNQFKTMEQLNFEITWNVNVQELLYSNKYEAFPKEYRYDAFEHLMTKVTRFLGSPF